METLKTHGGWKLNKYGTVKYFKNGRANLHVEVRYCVENDSTETGAFWIRTKREALATWNQLVKNHKLGGAVLTAELFPLNEK